MDETTKTIEITGRVQGVGYRYWLQQTALQLGVTGWVRNRRDGAVEATFHATDSIIDDMIERCRKGPYGARVETIEVVSETDDNFIGFEIRATE